MKKAAFLMSLAVLAFPLAKVNAGDWPGFRGPSGNGVSPDAKIPVSWGDSKNLVWKLQLPGQGSSSPITWGDKVFITCFSGAGEADLAGLKRQLICVDKNSGKEVWQSVIPAALPDDPYRGYLTQHGYASATPVTDGESVFVFFGKSGVCAFDFQGKKLWQKEVGKESGNRRWGSAGSPILYKDLVIINASEESRAIIALEKKTGREAWRAEANNIELSYSTPQVVQSKGGEKVLVVPVPGEVWGLDPDTGRLKWFAKTSYSGNTSPSVVQYGDLVIAMGGFPQTGTAAVRIGGKGDVTSTAIAWTSSDSSYVPSPVVLGEHLYWVNDRGLAFCSEAKSGKIIYKERLPIRASAGAVRPVYASVVLAGDKLIAVSRQDGAFVLKVGPAFQLLSQNRMTDDQDFNASPAISDGKIYLRSNQALYCIGEK